MGFLLKIPYYLGIVVVNFIIWLLLLIWFLKYINRFPSDFSSSQELFLENKEVFDSLSDMLREIDALSSNEFSYDISDPYRSVDCDIWKEKCLEINDVKKIIEKYYFWDNFHLDYLRYDRIFFLTLDHKSFFLRPSQRYKYYYGFWVWEYCDDYGCNPSLWNGWFHSPYRN